MGNSSYQCSFSHCTNEERDKFKFSHCCLPISVGQKYHEGEQLEAIFNLLNSTFKKCTIIVADTLQRHNLLNTQDVLNAKSLTLARGDQWMKMNHELIEKLVIQVDIIRWDSLINHKMYPRYRENVNKTFVDVKYFRNALESACEEYLKRYSNKNITASLSLMDDVRGYCYEYLKEECAVAQMWAGLGYQYNYEVYPRLRSQALEANYNLFIKTCYPDILKGVSLRFKKLKTENIIKLMEH